jgi:hypothetical protein
MNPAIVCLTNKMRPVIEKTYKTSTSVLNILKTPPISTERLRTILTGCSPCAGWYQNQSQSARVSILFGLMAMDGGLLTTSEFTVQLQNPVNVNKRTVVHCSFCLNVCFNTTSGLINVVEYIGRSEYFFTLLPDSKVV